MLVRWASKQFGLPSPINDLTLSMFRKDNGRIKFKLKAAEARHMLPVTIRILELFGTETAHDQLRMDCCRALQPVCEEMTHRRNGGAARLRRSARQHCILHAELAAEWKLKDPYRKARRITPKRHNVPTHMRRSNPRLGQSQMVLVLRGRRSDRASNTFK